MDPLATDGTATPAPARDEGERAGERTRRLLAVTSALAAATTLREAAATVVEQGMEGLGADGGLFVRPTDQGERLELVHALGYPDRAFQAWGTYPVDARMPTAEVFRTGVPLFLESRDEALRRFPGLAETADGAAMHAWTVVPLVSRGETIGVLTFRSTRPGRRWSDEDRAFVFALAQQGAVALERARLFEAERGARERMQLLADAGTLLASPLDLQGTLDALARLVVPRIADWCFVEVPTADGRIEPVAVHHRDPELVAFAWEVMRRYPVDPSAPHGTGRVLRTGETELVPEIPAELLLAVALDADHREVLRRLAFRSYVSVPLRVRGRTVGVLSLVMAESGRRFDADDVPFAGEVAQRAALAMDNARLFAAEHEARRQAELAADRSRRLQAVTAALSEAATPAQVAAVCVVHGCEALGAHAGSLGVLEEGGTLFRIVHTVGYPPVLEERFRRFPLTPGKPLSDAVLRRVPVLLGSREAGTAAYPWAYAEMEGAGTVAFAAVPVVAGGRALAGLSFSFPEERAFDEGERTFLATLGEQAAQALERARLFEAEQRARAAAEQLQALTAALSEATATGSVGAAMMEGGIRAAGADAGVLALLTPAGDELEIVASTGYPPAACMGPGRRWPAAAAIPLAEATRTGRPVLVPSREAWGARYPGAHLPTSGSAAWAAIPLVLEGPAAGALLWTYLQPREFDAAETALLETMTRQCAGALERARLLESERHARAEAEAANRGKTEFLSAMSHELRTPLNAIAGYVDLLELGVRGPLTPVQLSDLGRIRRAQGVLLGLINDILNFARIEAGRMEYRSEPVPLRPLLEELEELIAPQVSAKELRYHCRPCDDGVVALGDAERIRQVMLNLLTNAVKFTEAGGGVEVWAEVEEGRATVRVTDTGRGIPPDRLEAIFDPFVQVDRQGTPESQQGVGLGLAISRELARAMGGELTAASEPGRGSTFALSLPLAE